MWQESHFVHWASEALLNEQNAIPATGGGESRAGESSIANPVGPMNKMRFLPQVGGMNKMRFLTQLGESHRLEESPSLAPRKKRAFP